MQGLKDFLKKQDDVHSIISGFSSGMQEQFAAGLSGSSRSVLVSLLEESTKRPILLVTLIGNNIS